MLRKVRMHRKPSLGSSLSAACETVPMFRWLMTALSRPFKEKYLVLPLSMSLSLDDRWCKVFGFVSTGSVSSSTLQIFWDASHSWGLLCSPIYLLGHFPRLRHIQGSTSTGVFKGGWQTVAYATHTDTWRQTERDCVFWRQSAGKWTRALYSF